MELSKRLEMVAGLVTQERIADIGTDHGYVPIYLYKQGRIKKAYACDVRKGPLEKCRKNIALYGAEDVIEMMLAGATAVEIGAANLVDPFICKKIIEDLPLVMEKYNIKDLNDIIGGAHK